HSSRPTPPILLQGLERLLLAPAPAHRTSQPTIKTPQWNDEVSSWILDNYLPRILRDSGNMKRVADLTKRKTMSDHRRRRYSSLLNQIQSYLHIQLGRRVT